MTNQNFAKTKIPIICMLHENNTCVTENYFHICFGLCRNQIITNMEILDFIGLLAVPATSRSWTWNYVSSNFTTHF